MNWDALWGTNSGPTGCVVMVISRQAQTFSCFDEVTVFGVQTTGRYKGQTFIAKEFVLGIRNIAEGDK